MASLNRGKFYVSRDKVALIAIDFQEKLLPAINKSDTVISFAKKAIEGAHYLGIPVIVTEQVPDKMGQTIPDIKNISKQTKTITKSDFSCFGEAKFMDLLDELNIKNIIICGVESHVCVLQTALDGISAGYNVYLLVDAIGSRRDFDKEIAIKRFRYHGGNIITTEMMIFELLISSRHPEFKNISKLVK